jgi:hypothetical protein
MLRRTMMAGALLAACAAWPALGRGAGSVEARASGGTGQVGAGASASADLGAKGRWTLSVSDDFINVTGTSAPSRTDEASLGLSYADGDPWQSKLGVDYSDDSVNKVAYAGPSFGLTYSAPAPDAATDDGQGGGDDDAASPWTLSFDASIHAYRVDLGANATQNKTRAGVPYSLQDDDGTLDLTQFCPLLGWELPLFRGRAALSLGYGHDFYDKDPVVVASLIARRLTVGSGSGRAGTMVGALYTDSASVGATLKLGAGLTLGLQGSDSQLVSPAIWAQVAEASLNGQWGSYSARAAWDDTFQAGTATPELSVSVGIDF